MRPAARYRQVRAGGIASAEPRRTERRRGGEVTEREPAVREGHVRGWRAVHLTSDVLEVTVLPDKGADIYALTDLASGIDPLLRTPWGLQPPGTPPRPGSSGMAFLENYEGGGRSCSRIPMTRQVTAA